ENDSNGVSNAPNAPHLRTSPQKKLIGSGRRRTFPANEDDISIPSITRSSGNSAPDKYANVGNRSVKQTSCVETDSGETTRGHLTTSGIRNPPSYVLI